MSTFISQIRPFRYFLAGISIAVSIFFVAGYLSLFAPTSSHAQSDPDYCAAQPSGTLDPNSYPQEEADVINCVFAQDSFCQNTRWDEACVNIAGINCGGVCSGAGDDSGCFGGFPDNLCDIENNENYQVCTSDCGCGDMVCDNQEAFDGSCPADCGAGDDSGCNGGVPDGFCDAGIEDSLTCVSDCFCGDAVCDLEEQNSGSCPLDCGGEPGGDAICGNEIVENGETCDDGNSIDTDGCSNLCTATCGDGIVVGTEQCDDGNTSAGDGCGQFCSIEYGPGEYCGDGVVSGYEECDDSNANSGDGCSEYCQYEPVCGDGIITGNEACDDGNTTDGDGCSALCLVEYADGELCGNGVIEGTEQCDDGNGVAGDGCLSNCTLEYTCGNFVLEGNEWCDDGNTTNGDGCNAFCHIEYTPGTACGNGFQDLLEQCDDGNTFGGDGCDPLCRTEAVCGDFLVSVGETCDDGNLIDGDGCSSSCQSICGDAIVPLGGIEQCDDGMQCSDGSACSFDADCSGIGDEQCLPRNGDGCTNQCQTICGDGVTVAPTEQCDGEEGCSDQCQPICGDGILLNEYCDDGNNIDGDGCSSFCTYEYSGAGYCGDGFIQAAEQCDDGSHCSDGTSCNDDNECSGIGDGQCTARGNDGCNAFCHEEPICGNFQIETGESCDNGLSCSDGTLCVEDTDCSGIGDEVCIARTADGCSDQCQSICGDGIVVGLEQCDDGNLINGDGCSSVCLATCGDGITAEPFEQCDGEEGCSDQCQPICGDGILLNEYCDDGNLINGDGCSDLCSYEYSGAGYCGDGFVQGLESCDPGMSCSDGTSCLDDTDCQGIGNGSCMVRDAVGCDAYCHTIPVCGDTVIEGDEQCDNGGQCANGDFCTLDADCFGIGDGTCSVVPTYGCSAQCTTTCGDGIVAGQEQCDDGNTLDGDGCSAQCMTTCGDGITMGPTERCDGEEGCSLSCEPICGDGIILNEYCDDGNDDPFDTCSNTCTYTGATCGDGIVESIEECDAGSACTNGDVCTEDADCLGIGDGICHVQTSSTCTEYCRYDRSQITAPGALSFSAYDAGTQTLTVSLGAPGIDPNFLDYLIGYRIGTAINSGNISNTVTGIDQPGLNDISFGGLSTIDLVGLEPAATYAVNTFMNGLVITPAEPALVFTTLPVAAQLVAVPFDAAPAGTYGLNFSLTSSNLDAEYAICRSDDGQQCSLEYVTGAYQLGSEFWHESLLLNNPFNPQTGEVAEGQDVRDLAPNTSYTFLVQTRNTEGDAGPTSTPVTVTTHAAAPTAVAVADQTNSTTLQLSLSWSLSDASGLYIEQDTGCNGTYDVVRVNTPATTTVSSTIQTDLSGNTCYQYRLSSYNSAGVRNAPHAVQTNQITTPPSAPSAVALSAATESSLTWSWDAPTGATSYQVYEDVDGVWDFLGQVADPTFTLSDLAPDELHCIAVHAQSAHGVSVRSSRVCGASNAQAVTGFVSTDVTTNSISLFWNDVVASDYYIYDLNQPAINSGWISGTTYTFTGDGSLTPNTPVTLAIKSRNQLGAETVPTQITRYTAQAEPLGISFTEVSADQITISIDGTFVNNGDDASRVVLQRADGFTHEFTGPSTTLTNTGLSGNTAYTYTAYAVNGDGEQTNTISMSRYTPPAAVTTLNVAVVDETTLALSFIPQTNSSSTRYAVYDDRRDTYIDEFGIPGVLRLATYENWFADTPFLGPSTTVITPLTLQDLVPGAAYAFAVSATGDTELLATGATSTPVYTNPKRWTGLSAEALSQHDVQVAIQNDGSDGIAPNDASVEAALYDAVTGRYVAENGSLSSDTPVWQTPASWGAITVQGLFADQPVCLYALAKNAVGTEAAIAEDIQAPPSELEGSFDFDGDGVPDYSIDPNAVSGLQGSQITSEMFADMVGEAARDQLYLVQGERTEPTAGKTFAGCVFTDPAAGANVYQPVEDNTPQSVELADGFNELVFAEREELNTGDAPVDVAVAAGINPEQQVALDFGRIRQFDQEAVVVRVGGQISVTRKEAVLGTGGAKRDVSLRIPADTIIAAPAGWDGTFQVPTVRQTDTVTSPQGTVVEQVLRIGYGSSRLSFSNPVKLTFPDKAGKRIAWSQGDQIPHEITTVCNDAIAPTNIPTGGECIIDCGEDGQDRCVFTYHATDFFVFDNEVVPEPEPEQPGQQQSEPIRGGGGGGSIFEVILPEPTLQGLLINGGARLTTSNRLVTVTPQETSNDAVAIALSLRSDFSGVQWQFYNGSSVVYELPDRDGAYTIYAKIKNASGKESDIYLQRITLDRGKETNSDSDPVQSSVQPLTVVLPANQAEITSVPFTISGKATPYTDVHVSIAGSRYTITADDFGAYAVTVLDQLYPGVYLFTVSQPGTTIERTITITEDSFTTISTPEVVLQEPSTSEEPLAGESSESESNKSDEDAIQEPASDDAVPTYSESSVDNELEQQDAQQTDLEQHIREERSRVTLSQLLRSKSRRIEDQVAERSAQEAAERVDEIFEALSERSSFFLVYGPGRIGLLDEQPNVFSGDWVTINMRPADDVERITVRLYSEDETRSGWIEGVVLTESDTRFEGMLQLPADLPAGTYRLVATMSGEDAQQHLSKTIKVLERGQIVDKQGQPITQARVSVYENTPQGYQLWHGEWYDQTHPILTGKNGRYGYAVPAGMYYLVVEAQGFDTFQTGVLRFEEDGYIHMDITLKSSQDRGVLRVIWNAIISLITTIFGWFG